MGLTKEQKQKIAIKIDIEGLDYYMINYAQGDSEDFDCKELKVLADKWSSLESETDRWLE